jgi:hypothetical protein
MIGKDIAMTIRRFLTTAAPFAPTAAPLALVDYSCR